MEGVWLSFLLSKKVSKSFSMVSEPGGPEKLNPLPSPS
jgi:hypothetical protein